MKKTLCLILALIMLLGLPTGALAVEAPAADEQATADSEPVVEDGSKPGGEDDSEPGGEDDSEPGGDTPPDSSVPGEDDSAPGEDAPGDGVTPAEDAEPAATTLQGTGKVNDPYIISSPTDLVQMAEMVNSGLADYTKAYYKVAAADKTTPVTIDMEGVEMAPIGDGSTDAKAFMGQFDGNNSTIENLSISVPAGDPRPAGLFGVAIYGGTAGNPDVIIKDLTLKTISITNASTKSGNTWPATGGLVGKAFKATIRGCEVIDSKSRITGAAGGVGGLVGESGDGTLVVTSASDSVVEKVGTGTTYLGGIVGWAYGGTMVQRCANYSAVIDGMTGDAAGGIVGFLYDSVIKDCLNLNFVYAPTAGGIAGIAQQTVTDGTAITNCYATSEVITSETTHQIGGIVGLSSGAVTYTGCVALNENLGRNVQSDTADLVGRIIGAISTKTAARPDLNPNKVFGYVYTTRSYEYYIWPADGNKSLTRNGTDCTAAQFGTDAFWQTTLGYSSEYWTFNAAGGKLPKLEGVYALGGADDSPSYPPEPQHIVETWIRGDKCSVASWGVKSGVDVAELKWQDALGNTVTGDVTWAFDYPTDAEAQGLQLAETTDITAGGKKVGEKRNLIIPGGWDDHIMVKVTLEDTGIIRYMSINYYTVPATGIELEPALLRLKPGGSGEVALNFTPEGGTTSYWADTSWSWQTKLEGVDFTESADERSVTVSAEAGAKPGIGVLKVTGKLNGVTKTATARVAVVGAATSLGITPQALELNIGESATLDLSASPADALLDDVVWTSSNIAIATVDDSASKTSPTVTAVAPGTITVSASMAGVTEAATCKITVLPASYAVETLEYKSYGGNDSNWFSLSSHWYWPEYQTIELHAKATTQTAGHLTWHSSNPQAARLLGPPEVADGIYSQVSLETRAAGQSRISVCAPDGTVLKSFLLYVIGSTTLTPQVNPYILISTAITGSVSFDFSFNPHIDSSIGGLTGSCKLLDFETHQELEKSAGNIIVSSLLAPPFFHLNISRADNAQPFTPGRYILHVEAFGIGNPTSLATAEMVLEVVAGFAATANDASAYRLATKSAKVNVHSTGDVKGGLGWTTVALTRAGDGKLPPDFDGAAKLRFKDGVYNDRFEFVYIDSDTFSLRLKNHASGLAGNNYDAELAARKKLPGTTSGELVIDLGGGVLLPVEGKLKVTLDKKVPKLPNVTYKTPNIFYEKAASLTYDQDKLAATLYPNVKGITAFVKDTSRPAGKDAPAWITLQEGTGQSAGTVTKLLIEKQKKTLTGNVFLKAKLKDFPGTDISSTIRVTHSYTAAGLKLSASTAKIYLGSTAGTPLTLKTKSSKNSLGSLGVQGLALADTEYNATTYPWQASFKVAGFDAVTGAFRLVLDESALPAGAEPWNGARTKVLLRVTLWDSAYEARATLDLPLTVTSVKVSTAVRLKAAKSSVTLNPNIPGGEATTLALSTTIAGYSLAGKRIEAEVWTSNGKARAEIIDKPVGANVIGSTLYLYTGADCAFGKTWKVKVTLYDAYTNAKGSQNVTATVTVRTLAKNPATGNTTKYDPKVTLHVKGVANITTASAATITARFTNYNGGFFGTPGFEVTGPGKTATTIATDLFNFRRTSANTWEVSVKYYGDAQKYLATGDYYVKMLTPQLTAGCILGADTPAVKLRVTATRPKLTVTPKRVSLQNNDDDDKQLVTITPAAGSGVYLQKVALKLPAGATAESYPYKLVPVSKNSFYVAYNSVTADKARPTTLTVNVWIEGVSTSGQATTTVRVPVSIVKK